MTTTSWVGKDANGNSIAFVAEQATTNGPLVPHTTQEIGGALVSSDNPFPVADAIVDAAMGAAGTGINPPAGGSGILGFLSGIFQKLSTTVSVSWSGQSVGVTGTVAVVDTNAELSLVSINNNTTGIATAAGQASALTPTTAAATALGTPADAEWSGTGPATVIAALKAIWGVSGGTVVITPEVATPTGGTAYRVVTGGTAVVAITGPVKGGYIVNPESAADQGIVTAEQLYVDPVAAPGSTPGTGNGTTVSLDPGQPWTLPTAIPSGVSVRVNAPSSGHSFTVVTWN